MWNVSTYHGSWLHVRHSDLRDRYQLVPYEHLICRRHKLVFFCWRSNLFIFEFCSHRYAIHSVFKPYNFFIDIYTIDIFFFKSFDYGMFLHGVLIIKLVVGLPYVARLEHHADLYIFADHDHFQGDKFSDVEHL